MSFRFQSIYKVSVNDDLGSATFWNSRFQDIDVRLNATESYSATIDDAIAEVIALGLARVDTTIQPSIDTLTTEINTLTTSVAALQNIVVTDQNNVINQLNTLLTTAQTLVANMQSLGTISDGTF
jgi:hypothetical protein